MAARHKGKKGGGSVDSKVVSMSPAADVFAEAMDKKGSKPKEKKGGGKVEGGKSRMRLDKPGRKTGGRVGADTSPLSSANRTASPASEPHSKSSV